MKIKEPKEWTFNLSDPPRCKLIHIDKRGQITCFYLGETEFTLLSTKKDYARGGCVHKDNSEFFVVLEGKVEYHIVNEKDKETIKVYCKGENGIIPPNIPHWLIAVEDSLTLEWGATPEEKACKDPECRKVVDEINNIVDEME